MIRHGEETSGGHYTLYLEYLGGLIPLLKGKRASKLRPDFVIYDPKIGAKACSEGKSLVVSQFSTVSGFIKIISVIIPIFMNFVFKVIHKFKCLLKYNFYLHVVLIGSLAMNLSILETVIFNLSLKIDTDEY